MDEHPPGGKWQREGASPSCESSALQQILVHEPAVLVFPGSVLWRRFHRGDLRAAQTFHRSGHGSQPGNGAPTEGPLPLHLSAYHLRADDHLHRFRFRNGAGLQMVLHDVGGVSLRRRGAELNGRGRHRLHLAEKPRPLETCHRARALPRHGQADVRLHHLLGLHRVLAVLPDLVCEHHRGDLLFPDPEYRQLEHGQLCVGLRALRDPVRRVAAGVAEEEPEAAFGRRDLHIMHARARSLPDHHPRAGSVIG